MADISNGAGNGHDVNRLAGPGVNPLAGPGTDFKSVALGVGANLEALPAYFTDPLLGTGNLPGLAVSGFNNRALRQGTFVASSLCQWISNQSNIYIPDDGSQINWITEFQNALSAFVEALIPAGPNLGAYLPLAGGTMVGTIYFQPGISTVLSNSTWYYGRDTGGTARGLILKGSDNNVYINDGTAPYVIFNGTPLIGNNIYYSGRDTGGSARPIVGFLSDNAVHIGGNATVFADVGGNSVWSSGNVVTGNNNFFYCRDNGGQARAVLGLSASGNILQLGGGTVTDTHIYTAGWIYAHNNFNVLGQFISNAIGYLNGGGRAYIPGGNDPWQVYADHGFYARTRYVSGGTRDWSVGCLNSGLFSIADETGGAIRFEIDMNGGAFFFGPVSAQSNMSVSGGLTVYGSANIYNGLSVSSGNIWSAGEVQASSNIRLSGQLLIGGQPGIFDLGNGWLYFGGNFRTGGAIQADNYINSAGSIYAAGTLSCNGNVVTNSAVITNYIQDNGGCWIGGSTYTGYITVGANAYISGACSVAGYTWIGGPNAEMSLLDGIIYYVGKQSYTPRPMATRIGQGLEGFYMAGGYFVSWMTGAVGTGSLFDVSFTAPGLFQIANAGEGYKQNGQMWVNYSERRLKKNIEDYRPGLDVIRKLKPRRFQYNGVSPTVDDGKTQIGLVADEVEELMPELIRTHEGAPEGFKGIEATPVLYALVNAVRELAAKVEALEGRA